MNRSLQQLSAKEGQLVIKSPVNGIVLTLPVKQEQVVSPGSLLVNVRNQVSLRLKLTF